MKKFSTIILVILFFFFVSWSYKLVCLTLLAITWKQQIKEHLPYRLGYKAVIICLCALWLLVQPRYFYHSFSRVQLIYQDKKGNRVAPPLSHYLLNVALPEEEVMNMGVWAAKLGATFIPYVNGGTLLKQFQDDSNQGKISNFYRPYRRLNGSFNFLMSGTTSQVFNTIGLGKTQSVYLIKPKNYDKDKKYPVVFFCHGGLGNWKLYQGIWKNLEDYIVLSVGTEDMSGIFGYHDMKALFTKQLPFLKKQGFKVDKTQLHIMGLSNGGTAVNVAYNKFSKRFKSITFISTGIHQTYPIRSKVVLIGGGKDGSSSSLPRAARTFKKQGSPYAFYWDKEETHYILVNQADDICNRLKKEFKSN